MLIVVINIHFFRIYWGRLYICSLLFVWECFSALKINSLILRYISLNWTVNFFRRFMHWIWRIWRPLKQLTIWRLWFYLFRLTLSLSALFHIVPTTDRWLNCLFDLIVSMLLVISRLCEGTNEQKTSNEEEDDCFHIGMYIW